MSETSDSCNSGPPLDLAQEVQRRGRQAKDLWDNPYFQDLLSRLDQGYQEAILCLSPDQGQAFRDLKLAQASLGEMRNLIQYDIMDGAEQNEESRIVT